MALIAAIAGGIICFLGALLFILTGGGLLSGYQSLMNALPGMLSGLLFIGGGSSIVTHYWEIFQQERKGRDKKRPSRGK